MKGPVTWIAALGAAALGFVLMPTKFGRERKVVRELLRAPSDDLRLASALKGVADQPVDKAAGVELLKLMTFSASTPDDRLKAWLLMVRALEQKTPPKDWNRGRVSTYLTATTLEHRDDIAREFAASLLQPIL